MERYLNLRLKENEKKALSELKKALLQKFPDIEIFIYGSKARGNFTEYSDIDLLILLNRKVNTLIEEEIIGIVYELELKYGVIFDVLIEAKDLWQTPVSKEMPIYQNIKREGIKL